MSVLEHIISISQLEMFMTYCYVWHINDKYWKHVSCQLSKHSYRCSQSSCGNVVYSQTMWQRGRGSQLAQGVWGEQKFVFNDSICGLCSPLTPHLFIMHSIIHTVEQSISTSGKHVQHKLGYITCDYFHLIFLWCKQTYVTPALSSFFSWMHQGFLSTFTNFSDIPLNHSWPWA